jgi:curved DNA-binding protein
MADRRDFYEVLGVPRGASADEIQSAYRKLARAHHPDINKEPGSEQRFQEIAEAYDVLSDADTRRRYDTFGHDFRQVPEGVDPAEWARARAGPRARAGAGARGSSPFGTEEPWYAGEAGPDIEFGDIDDLFGGIFGRGRGRGGRRGWGPIAGADQEVEIELAVEEAYRGGRRTVTLTGLDGTRTFDVDIPAGVVDGERIRLAGQGGQGTGGAAPGDLYLVVRLREDRRYRVEGHDIRVELRLAPWEAALGTSVRVDTPGGEATVRVPPGTSSGRRLRLRGRGMPNRRGSAGDLYAEVRIMVPKSVSDEERKLFEELAAVSSFDPRNAR